MIQVRYITGTVALLFIAWGLLSSSPLTIEDVSITSLNFSITHQFLEPDDELSRIANDFMDRLIGIYRERNVDYWGNRGHPWLFKNQGLLLAGKVIKSEELGQFKVLIRNTNSNTCTASNYNIWVRVTGSEIIAGKAIPDDTTCSWTFPFEIQEAGDFGIQAKLISYLGQSDIEYVTCKKKRTGPVSTSLLSDWTPKEFTGFKFYLPMKQCCDVCSKRADCTHWISTKEKKSPVHCYFFNLNDPSTRRKKEDKPFVSASYWGVSRPYVGSIYLGCGWSYELSSVIPCVDNANDDRIPFIEDIISVEDVVTNFEDTSKFPICSLDEKVNGRWVDVKENETQCSEFKPDTKYGGQFPLQSFSKTDPGVCWFREDINDIATRCLEGDCPNLKKASQWRDSNVIQKVENSKYWGSWVPYEKCRYHLFTASELQNCITKKKINKIVCDGRSISRFLNVYVKQRADGINFYQGSDGADVLISTLRLPHRIWNDSYEVIKKRLKNMIPASSKHLKYFLSGMYISSERESHVLDDRAAHVTDTLSSPILKAKGWKEVNWHDISAAFTYESATQGDGLHIVGTPMKQIWTMVMNDLCQDTLS